MRSAVGTASRWRKTSSGVVPASASHPSLRISRPLSPFCSASVKVRPMAIVSPTDFIWIVSVGSAAGNFSKAKRGSFTTT